MNAQQLLCFQCDLRHTVQQKCLAAVSNGSAVPLMQADAHPGNILVMKGARIGLIDYGQSKQLPDKERLAFAALLVEMAKGRSGYGLALT